MFICLSFGSKVRRTTARQVPSPGIARAALSVYDADKCGRDAFDKVGAMANSYSALCDEFYLNLRLGTQMKMATDRATVVAFFERMQRLYPNMINFHQDGRHGESSIEESRDENSYKWMSLEPNRLSCGFLNPPAAHDAYRYNLSVLETVPYYLAVSPVDLDYLDVLWGFDFQCKGNHHELVAEALLGESPIGKLMEAPDARGINFELSGIVSLNDDARLHARVWVEPRTTPNQVRTGDYPDEMLSLYVIVRQWSGGRRLPELAELHNYLVEQGEKFIDNHVIGHFLSPIREAIARRS